MKTVKTGKKLFPPEMPLRQKLKRAALFVLCLGVVCFFAVPVIRDVFYLRNPEITYMNRLHFENGGEDSSRFYLRGVDITGAPHTFELDANEMEEGFALWQKTNYNLCAKISYLPHTSYAMSIEYIPEPSAFITDMYPPSPNLPKNWDSFSAEINHTVYTLPLPLSAFLNEGWNVSEKDREVQLAAANGLDSPYDRKLISLTNDEGQLFNVLVVNPTEGFIPVADGMVEALYASCGNYEFAGTQFRLPGGLMLGWSTYKDAEELYGPPDHDYGTNSVVYRLEGLAASLTLSFNEAGILEDSMIHKISPYQ